MSSDTNLITPQASLGEHGASIGIPVRICSSQGTAYDLFIPLLLTYELAAWLCSVSIPTLYRWSAEGKFPAAVKYPEGGTTSRIYAPDLLAWINGTRLLAGGSKS